MRSIVIAWAIFIAVGVSVVGQVHPFPGPGTKASESPMTGIVSSGLVAYWDMTTPYVNAATRTFVDQSGSGNDIQIGTDTLVDSGDPVVGVNYTDFNSQGKHLEMTFDSASLSLTGDMTIEVAGIRNYSGTGTKPLVTKGGGTSEFYYTLGISSNKAQLQRASGSTSVATNGQNTTEYTYLAVVVSGTTVTHYKNNVVNGTGTTGTPTDGTGKVWVGAFSTNYFTGQISRMRVYNRALTTEELTQNYNRDKIVMAGRGITLP